MVIASLAYVRCILHLNRSLVRSILHPVLHAVRSHVSHFGRVDFVVGGRRFRSLISSSFPPGIIFRARRGDFVSIIGLCLCLGEAGIFFLST